jgi:uncharacterized membrane protein YgdD (TMEM256/DUF423 family)
MNGTARSDVFSMAAAGVLGLTGVTLGALGAHALKLTLMERGTMAAWETGARYHLFHAVATLAVAVWLRLEPAGPAASMMRRAARIWCLGTILFSGSLYWLALGGPRWLGPVTPVGGLALMIGWLLVAIAAFRRSQ